jgi:hypothetical protein
MLRADIQITAALRPVGYVNDISDQGLGAGLIADQMGFVRLLQSQ